MNLRQRHFPNRVLFPIPFITTTRQRTMLPYYRKSVLVSLLLFALAGFCSLSTADVWIPDQGDGTYKNPVLFADYSDPDVVRVGQDFYLTSSSFNCVPGLPILHSRDLVNWQIIGHAIQQMPKDFDRVQHGNGIWAPSLRYHDGFFWIFVGDPDRGIYMTRAKDPTGPWSPLHIVKEGKGLIDPCPLWDEDGKAYLVHAFAKSRAGKNSMIVAQEMSPDGLSTIGEEKLVIDGRDDVHPTIEGPKFYKRDGWYYIFAPAGGVEFGWQMAARAKKVFGPYEIKRVLEQGSTDINGPHQGAWVELENGEDWFVHFQEVGAYGRLVHLNPMKWEDGWPVMGRDFDGNGVGEPVAAHTKPNIQQSSRMTLPQTTDEFDGPDLAPQWQWQGNPSKNWSSLQARPGWLRLDAVDIQMENLTDAPNQLLQKFPAPSFTATTLLEIPRNFNETRAGLVVMGQSYAALLVSEHNGVLRLEQVSNKNGWSDHDEKIHDFVTGLPARVWLRVNVEEGAKCMFSFSTDGENYSRLGDTFKATPGRWIGAKVGLISLGTASYAEFDSFHIE
jgi:beta-xylosidase